MSYDESRIKYQTDVISLSPEQIKWFTEKLIVGAKIRIGKEYSIFSYNRFKEDEIIELTNASFEYDCDLYISYIDTPAIWCDKQKDYDSIYHLFGNEFEYFFDCEILS